MKSKASDVPGKDASDALLYLMKARGQRIRIKNRILLQSLAHMSCPHGDDSTFLFFRDRLYVLLADCLFAFSVHRLEELLR